MIGALANLPIFGVLLFAAWLQSRQPDLYYRIVQEDEALEWSSFWSFAAAAGVYAWLALRRRRAGDRIPWLFAGIALFCGFVAMEEISWGQRLLGFRPPTYFLEHNFQQELNVHNIVGDRLRQYAFLAVVLGYGVVLPLGFLLRPAKALGGRLGIEAPALGLVPAFAATGLVYALYPWKHTGEWTELMLGCGMLFAGLIHLRESSRNAAPGGPWRPLAPLLAAWLVVIVLGAGTARLGWLLHSGTPEQLEAARTELAALREDFAAARTRTRCGLHKRVYTFARRHAQNHLQAGDFTSLVEQGPAAGRAQFFLDPWNSPYWIRHVCSDDRRRRAIFVYSLGPNRMRDSTRWQIVPDDIGLYVSRPDEPGEH